MNKSVKIPIPFRAPLAVSDKKLKKSKNLEKKLLICLAFNLFALGLFLGVYCLTINFTTDGGGLELSSQMKRPNLLYENGKPLIKPQVLDEPFWSRKCNFKLPDMKSGRIPLNSKFVMLNENCTSFAQNNQID